MEIQNQVALVTGANRGLGKAFVQVLLEMGVKKVYAGARHPESIEATERLVPVKIDVTNVENLAEKMPDVTLLINNAGIHQKTSLFDADVVEVVRKVCEVNTFGLLSVSRAIASLMVENGAGTIVNILSAGAWLSGLGNLAYSTSKAAALSLTNGMRAELNPKGIQVTAVHAGFIDTDMMSSFSGQKLSPYDVAKQTIEAVIDGSQEVLIDEMSRKSKQSASKPIPDFHN